MPALGRFLGKCARVSRFRASRGCTARWTLLWTAGRTAFFYGVAAVTAAWCFSVPVGCAPVLPAAASRFPPHWDLAKDLDAAALRAAEEIEAAIVSAAWLPPAAAIQAGVAAGLTEESQARRVRVYALLSVRDKAGALTVTLAANGAAITAEARIGRFGDPDLEASLTRVFLARFGALRRGPRSGSAP